MDDVQEASLAAKEKLALDLRTVISDAEELLQLTSSQTGERVAELRERMRENLRAARYKLEDAEEAIRERAREAARATDDYVHDHPWKAIGIAAGAGLLVGLLISRR
jgi:ElaB/YqjD/DUF883 family membrane-anchored ribosome-binding protein